MVATPEDEDCDKVRVTIRISNNTSIGGHPYDLALIKQPVNGSTIFLSGTLVTFNITVFNQGTLPAHSIELTDYIPAGLTLQDAAWTVVGDLAVRTINQTILPGTSIVVPITFLVDGTAPTCTVVNYAEISVDDGDDGDSTPDNINNDPNPIDDSVTDTEDDHDLATIRVCDDGGGNLCEDPVTLTITTPTNSTNTNSSSILVSGTVTTNALGVTVNGQNVTIVSG